MPVPLPGPDEVLLTRPSAEEAQAVAVGLAAAAAHPDGLTDLQRILLEAVTTALTDHPIDLAGAGPVTPDEFAGLLRRRSLEFRTRVVQLMVLGALVLRPLPAEVAARVEAFAAALGVDEGMVAVARRFAAGSLGLAAVDFQRNGYTRDWAPGDRHELHTSQALAQAWDLAVHDPTLAAQWAALEDLPAGTLGRGVWQLYAARGFVFPGLPGSAPPLLAQHDWVHVLADYGTTVEAELEVFSLIARANDDMRAFSLMAMVVSLFETGYLRRAAGLFQYDPGHLSGGSAGRDMAVRVADAMTRGAWCHDNETGADSIDFLRIDWFALADRPVDEVRDLFSLRPRSAGAVTAGSATPWEPGGISPFQLSSGREAAARAGRPYDSFGAEVTPPV
ncbi:MAG TPA: hypothetical protein VFM27_22130 [Acidimicrobiales bacterium]|nr:hypothetical protein [Acidimicrobiales bacterium]